MRSFQLNSGIQQYVEGLKGSKLEVGAILGRLGVGQRDLIFLLVKQQDSNASEGIEPSRASHSLPHKKAGQGSIDIDGLVEHLHRLAMLLIGGVQITGVYYTGAASASADITKQLMQAFSQYTAEIGRTYGSALILQIDPITKKLVAKEQTLAEKQQVSLKPCEVKFLELARHMVSLTCRHAVQLECTIPSDSTILSSHIQEQLKLEAARLKSAAPLVDNSMPGSTASVLDVFDLQSPGQNEVELLCPPACSLDSAGLGEDDQGKILGSLAIKGTAVGRCLAFDREPFDAAVAMLTDDVAQSLQARANLMVADAEEEDSRSKDILQPASGQAYESQMPQRAFFPSQEPWLQMSSYHFPGESRGEAQATAREATGLELEAKDIEWPEDRGHAAVLKSKGQANVGGKLTEMREGRPAVPFGLKTGQQALTIAIVICMVSCWISYLLAKRSAL